MTTAEIKSSEDEKVTDDDLKRHRVGGRLVTRREIMRSKKCTAFNFLFCSGIDCLNLYSYHPARGTLLADGVL
jgi:hypothetical protein